MNTDVGDGIRFPTGWHSHQGRDDNFGAQAVTAGHNAFGGTMKDVKPNFRSTSLSSSAGVSLRGHDPVDN